MAPWGGIFDFNFDGQVSWSEQSFGLMIVNECMKEDTDSRHSSSSSGSLFSNRATHSCYEQNAHDFETGSDLDDYDKEEYLEPFLEEDTYTPVNGDTTIPITLTVNVSYPGQEALEAIKREAYPDDRSFEAARYLCDLEQGTAWLLEDTDVETEKERCRFILERSCLAAKYLTAYNGFILAQAVQDHFALPIEVDKEDSEIKLFIDDLISDIAEEDPTLALDIWVWCIKEFGPYQKYLHHSWSLYGGILNNLHDYPENFRALVIKKLGADDNFAKGLLTENPDIPYGVTRCIATALEMQLTQDAQLMFVATVLNPLLKGKEIEAIINQILSDISNYEELETMERFQKFLMPIIKKINNKRIQRLVPKFQQTIAEYIDSVERTAEKYQYSRRYAWRKICEDGAPYDLDPLDFETEDAYKQAIQEEKYYWRFWYRESACYGLDVNDFETEEEYLEAFEARKVAVQQEQQARRQSAYPDTQFHTDKTVYSFCSVMFNGNARPYHYLTGEVDVEIGDQVVVPNSRPEGISTGTVVSVSKHLRSSAPFPVDKAKTILRKL